MTLTRMLRLAVRAMAAVALAASGIYVLVYLWRWEWNRALITGMMFLATLIVICTWAILGSLRKLDARVERLERRTRSDPQVAGTLRRANAEHAGRHFEWLREPPDRLSVFVPILLGAGAILSAIAYLIERLAGAVGGPTIDQRTAQLLAHDLPLGGPAQHVDPHQPLAVALAAPTRRSRGRLRTAIVGLGVVVLVAGSVWVLREATQTRPDPRSMPGRTEIDMSVSLRRSNRAAVDVAASLWSVCRNRVAPDVVLVDVRPGPSAERATLVLDRTVGSHARERVHGCLEDTVLERVQADVLAFDQVG